MFNDMTTVGWYRVNFDIGVSTKLKKWLNWNVSLSGRYFQPPGSGPQDQRFSLYHRAWHRVREVARGDLPRYPWRIMLYDPATKRPKGRPALRRYSRRVANFFRAVSARPAIMVPSKTMLPGSGTVGPPPPPCVISP
jgi:hypothetical protein